MLVVGGGDNMHKKRLFNIENVKTSYRSVKKSNVTI